MRTSGPSTSAEFRAGAAASPAGQRNRRQAQVGPGERAPQAVPQADADQINANGGNGWPNNIYGARELDDPGSPVGRVMIPDYNPGQAPPPAPRRAANPRQFQLERFVAAPCTPELPVRAQRRYEDSPSPAAHVHAGTSSKRSD